MGIFDEKRTYIASSTLQLVQQTPDIIRQSILNSVLANREIVPDMLDAILGSFANKDVARMYEYAKNEYVNGLPEGSKGWAPAPTSTIEKVLAKEFSSFAAQGKTFRVLTSSLGGPSAMHIGVETFVNDPRFVSWTYWNEPDLVGEVVWQGTYNYSDGDYWGTGFKLKGFTLNTEAPIFISGLRFRNIYDSFYYKWKYYAYHEPIVNDGIYYTVEFEILNPDGSVYIDNKWPRGKRYWSYYPKSLRYPELNLEEDAGSIPTGTFYFPVVPIRVNNVELNDKNTELYKTGKKLLKFLEVDIDEIHTAVLKNPDINSIDHAYIMFGIDIHTKTEVGIKYLYEYFEDEYTRQTVTKNRYFTWFYNPTYSHPPLNSVVIKDDTYNVTLVFSYIDITEQTGVIGEVGYVDKTINIFRKEPETSRPPGYLAMQYEDHRNAVFLRKQISPTRFRTIEVAGLCLANNIHGSGKSWWTGLWGAINLTGGDQPNAPIPVPLNVAIAYDSLSKMEANPLYYEALHIVFNCFEVIKLKWYETSFFRWFTQVIAIAVGAFTGGLSNLVTSITTAVSAGITGLSIFVGKFVVSSMLAQYTFKFAVDKLGYDWALGFSAVLSSYGIAGQKGMFNLPFADDLLFMSTKLLEAGKQVTTDLIKDTQEEFKIIEQEYQSNLSKLEQINKELAPNNLLDPLGLYTEIGMTPFDTPSTYIERALAVNTGLQSISAVSNFVENSLRLPKI